MRNVLVIGIGLLVAAIVVGFIARLLMWGIMIGIGILGLIAAWYLRPRHPVLSVAILVLCAGYFLRIAWGVWFTLWPWVAVALVFLVAWDVVQHLKPRKGPR